jgi:hypothetical protein
MTPTPAISPAKTNSRVLRGAAICWGLAGLPLALLSASALAMVGFPDSHFTPYAMATIGLRRVLLDLCVVQSLYFILVGVLAKRLKAVWLCPQILLAALFIIAPMLIVPDCAEISMCTSAYEAITHTQMDDGAGG